MVGTFDTLALDASLKQHKRIYHKSTATNAIESLLRGRPSLRVRSTLKTLDAGKQLLRFFSPAFCRLKDNTEAKRFQRRALSL